MKGFWKKAVSIFCAAIMVIGLAAGFQTASAAAKFQDAKLGPLHVKGTKLCDKKGHTVQLRGISTHGLSWYPQYVNDKCFKELHDKWGANVVRLAMYTEEYNGYCSGDDKNRKDLKKLVGLRGLLSIWTFFIFYPKRLSQLQ